MNLRKKPTLQRPKSRVWLELGLALTIMINGLSKTKLFAAH
jgi:hypothetical protein